jgi:hypothetical protein
MAKSTDGLSFPLIEVEFIACADRLLPKMADESLVKRE